MTSALFPIITKSSCFAMNASFLIRISGLVALASTAYSCAAQTPATNPIASQGNFPAPPADRISISAAQIINESARGQAQMLFDEQDVAGDPRVGATGQPKNTWTIGYQGKDLYYPLTAIIDLGAMFRLSDICIYDTNGSGEFRLEAGTPKAWTPLLMDPLQGYQKWNRHQVDVKTRYLHVIIPSPEVLVPELVLFGRAEGPIASFQPPTPKPRQRPLMDQFIGTNAFIDDPLEKMSAVGYIREYHNWDWDAGDGAKGTKPFPDNLNAFAPAWGGGGAWNFDEYYARLKNAGISVVPAIQGSVQWLTPQRDDKPAGAGQDASQPEAYQAHADEMFQYAARYGSRKVDDAKLKLAPGQPRVSGLGYLSYYENANEPDKWWKGRVGYSNPYELAAQCSADYDGHKKRMGDTFGIKNADPNAKLVLGGLAGLNLEYIKAMKAWADWNRDGDFPLDVINVHTYSNDSGTQQLGKHGVTPEQDHLKDKLKELADYRDRYLPGVELWLTEFGYDINPASPQRASAFGDTSAEEMQANWIVRSYFAVAASGFDRAAQYMLRDVNPQDATQFSSSGLVTQKGEWKAKPSWYYTYTLKNRLAGMRFAGEVDSGNPNVWIYKFKSDKGNGAYALWCPTDENASVPNFALPIGGASAATLVNFQAGETSGVASPLKLNGSKVALDVSEKPVLVLVDKMAD